jgi:hypothetical protein
MEKEVGRELKKASNFLAHFLEMAGCYLSDLREEKRLTRRLKVSWKWIK